MKARFQVVFLAGPQDGVQGVARLEADLAFAPYVGLEVVHPVWHDARKVLNVTWNLEDESFFVALEEERYNDKAQTSDIKGMYRGHGWKISGEDD